MFSLAACADRERANPLDPQNPDTLGKPTGLRVLSSRDTVFLRWDRLNLNDIAGIQLYRKTNIEPEFSPLVLIQPEKNNFEDTNIEFGIEYMYQISAVGDNFESQRSDEVRVEPGPTFNWVADNGNRQLFKLTHDARHRIQSTFGFLTIIDIEPNPKTGEIWVIDFISSVIGEVVRISSSGEVLEPIVRLVGPEDASLYVSSGDLWIADSRAGRVVKLDPVGNELFSISNFSSPISVSVDQRTGDCWVGDDSRNEVIKISSDGQERMVSSLTFNSVKWIDVDSNDGSVWVSDRTRVLKLNEMGLLEFEISQAFSFAHKIAVNKNNGEVWIVNWNPSTISKYNSNGQKIFELDGFLRPEDLAINLFDNSCLVADTDNDRVVRISSDGQSVEAVQEILIPIAVGVQNEAQEWLNK